MGMMYSQTFTNVSISALQDIFTIVAPADAIVVLHSCYFGQRSDFGDAQAEGLRIEILRRSGAGSGGTTPTPSPQETGFPATPGSTVAINRTTPGAAGAVLYADTFNIQAGWQYRPTPEERIIISPSGILGISLPAAPADQLDGCQGTCLFEEIGG